MSELHKSNSQLQSDKEACIIKQFFKNKLVNYKLDANYKNSFRLDETKNIKMQFDLYIKEAKIIGEVYVTELPFNSGRKRKFMNDILKMLTFEKFMQKEKLNPNEHFEKYYFLTASEDQLEVEKGKFIKHSRETSLIGKDTWLNLMLEEFDVKLFYYCVEDSFWEKLKETRANQKEGMSIK